MASPENTTSPQRYSRVPKEEHQQQPAAVIVENLRLDGDLVDASGSGLTAGIGGHHDDDLSDDETSSLVSSDIADAVFRKSAASGWDGTGTDETLPSTAGGDTILTNNSQNNNNHPTSPASLMRSRSNDSNSHLDLGGDSDWEADDDEAGIRRYHVSLDMTQQASAGVRTDIPLPAEFSRESLPRRLWQSFMELRTGARQRRAARLLTMPSQSWMYQTHACLLTTCCDATDWGILVAAIWLGMWFFVGLAAGMGSTWWMTGLFLFVIRITARRSVECWQNKRRKRRQRLSSGDGMELHAHAAVAAASVFRDNADGKSSDRGSFHEVL